MINLHCEPSISDRSAQFDYRWTKAASRPVPRIIDAFLSANLTSRLAALRVFEPFDELDSSLTDIRRQLWETTIDFNDWSCPMLYPFPRPKLDDVAIQVVRCLVHEAIRKGWFRRDQFEDLVQDACLHLLQKARHYNPDRAAWSTFSSLVVRNYLSRRRKRLRSCDESLDSLFDSSPAQEIDDAQLMSKRFSRTRAQTEWMELEEEVAHAIDQLPDELRAVCEQFQVEENVEHVARQLGLSRSTVYRRRQLIRESTCFETLVEYL